MTASISNNYKLTMDLNYAINILKNYGAVIEETSFAKISSDLSQNGHRLFKLNCRNCVIQGQKIITQDKVMFSAKYSHHQTFEKINVSGDKHDKNNKHRQRASIISQKRNSEDKNKSKSIAISIPKRSIVLNFSRIKEVLKDLCFWGSVVNGFISISKSNLPETLSNFLFALLTVFKACICFLSEQEYIVFLKVLNEGKTGIKQKDLENFFAKSASVLEQIDIILENLTKKNLITISTTKDNLIKSTIISKRKKKIIK